MAWSYDPVTATYAEDGEPLTDRQLADVRDAIADGFEAEAAALVLLWASGRITLEQWALAFAGLIGTSVIAGYLLGYGGAAMLDRLAQAEIVALILAQHAYIERFADDIATSLRSGAPMSRAMMTARSGMYAGATVEAYEQALAAAKGVQLPYWPADGGTKCKTRCRCWWAYEQVGPDETHVYWHTQEDDAVCRPGPGGGGIGGTCLEREAESHPVIVRPRLDPARVDPKYRLAPLTTIRVPPLRTDGRWQDTYPQDEEQAA